MGITDVPVTGRLTTRTLLASACAGLALISGSCSSQESASPSRTASGAAATEGSASLGSPSASRSDSGAGPSVAPGRPPEILVRGDRNTLRLRPHIYEFNTGAVHGPPPDPLPDIGSATELIVEYPQVGWKFSARLERAGAEPNIVAFSANTDKTFVLRGTGLAGTYTVHLVGERDDIGTVNASFVWTAAIPPPRVALPAHPDQEAEPLMGVDGILRGDASTMCVWQENSANPAERTPILWPPAYTVARDGADLVVHDAAGTPVIRTGQYLSANGGLTNVRAPEDPCMLGAARALSVFSPKIGSAPHQPAPRP